MKLGWPGPTGPSTRHYFLATVLALACAENACGSSSDSQGASSGRAGTSTTTGTMGTGSSGSASTGTAGTGPTVATGSGGGTSTGATTGSGAGGGGAGGTMGVGGAGGSAGAGAGGQTGSVDAGRDAPATPGEAGPLGDNLAPAQGALLGLYYGAGTVAATDASVGRPMAVHLVYYAWADDWTAGTTKSDLSAGRIPLVNWEPAGIDFNNIVNGSLDATINARAAGAKALGKKFFLDFAAEMNGDEAWSGNNAPLYVSAYRHMHDLFVAAGATNVVWAWCPNVTDTNGGNAATMNYYPGDDYVDWTGVDGYNWGTTNGGWQTFKQVFQGIYPLLAAKGKPILIGEMASAEAGGNKAQWIDDMIPTLKASYPLFKGVVWFDVNKETDWRIASSPATLDAFKRMANDPFFNP